MRTLLVTGGAGFIGSHAIDYLLKKYSDYNIINMDKLTYAGSMSNMTSFYDDPRHTFIKGDIADKALVHSLFLAHPISGVIHFAAESHVDNSISGPDTFIHTNILGTFTLLEVARHAWKGKFDTCRFHHISTDEVYGALGKEGCFTETSAYAPNSPYSASKASSDHLVRSYGRTYGLNVITTHCSNNYGPHQHAEKLIPTVIRKALSLDPIPVYGNGQNVRDWIYVFDHCEAIDILFHQATQNEVYNIGGECELGNLELVKMICRLLDSKRPLSDDRAYESLISFVKDRAGHDFRYAISNDKVQHDLGWKPTTLLQKGLEVTVDYYLRMWLETQKLSLQDTQGISL